MKATVTERGHVTIPKRLRKKLGIRPGMVLDFDMECGRLIAVVNVDSADPVEQVYGCLNRSKSCDELLKELRGAV